MDAYQDAVKVNEKASTLDAQLLKHRQILIDIFKEVQHPKQDMLFVNLETILSNWKSMVELLEMMINTMEQATLMNAIEVVGLPEKYAKDIAGVARILSQLLHISINDSYIKSFGRIGDAVAPDSELEGGSPRNLMIDLINQNIKKRILTVAESVVLSIIGSDQPMYINEHLTAKNNQLLKRAREETLRHNINNVWVEDGKIYARRSDASLVFEIRSDADIEKMAHY